MTLKILTITLVYTKLGFYVEIFYYFGIYIFIYLFIYDKILKKIGQKSLDY